MATLYITTQGATVQRRSGQFLVAKKTNIIQNVPETHVKKIILVGSVNLTTPVVAYCLNNQIEVVFLSQGGKFRGRLNGDWSGSVEKRRQQFERGKDRDFCLAIARNIVAGKINNQIAFARRQLNAGSLSVELSTLISLRKKALTGQSTESLLGIEGSASASYFRLFGTWVPKPFSFTKRTAHPPLDETNALLSLTYTLLYNRIVTHLNTAGLDPFLGFFHQPRNGHAALASDLLEEFRPIIADALVIKLLRKRQIQSSDFDRSGGRIILSPVGQKKFFSEFESKMNSKRETPSAGGNQLSFSKILEFQTNHMSRVITRTDNEYKPFLLK